ncbi:alpha-L-fucosidase [Sphingobacterium sp. DN00404]|uniref:alpha-L-fucosidase n=1 Tax=Sphingobacterium micropteri TaxID=2763501 RepID=A0ABR7YL80_9SPHI|nr:alpha-L-fucosidase [Sphingobacterium micropteri]MBD1432068.1 alpha-L-fucosidase [Sphingobacterium micropteri]
MKYQIIIFLLLLLPIKDLTAQSKSEPFEGVPGWLETQEKRLAWFKEARFGIFIHWGLYSAAGGVFEGKTYPQHYAEWIQTWGKVPSKRYAEHLRPKFTLRDFDPKQWAKLVKESGAKYMILTSRHHEGFSLFNSRQPFAMANDVTGTANLSPAGRDLYREIMEAFQQEGLKTGAYYSLLDWQHPDSYEAFQLNPNPAGHVPDHERYKDYLYGQVKELANNYGSLDVLWADFSNKDYEGESWGTKRMLADLIKWQPNILINNRFWNGLENKNGDIGTPEKYVPPTGIAGINWEVNHTMNESYGYSAHDQNWKSFPQIMHLLIETVSKGGNFLLNVGPDGNGKIPDQAMEILERVGQWMSVNSESIYGTQASPFRKLDWGYCTIKGNKLYLHVFDIPSGNVINVPLKNTVKSLHEMGSEDIPMEAVPQEIGIGISIPSFSLEDGPKVLVMEVEGALEIEENVTQALSDGRIVLSADNADIHTTHGMSLSGASHDFKRPNALAGWSHTDDKVSWKVKIQRPGEYDVLINYLPLPKDGGTIVFHTDGTKLTYRFEAKELKAFEEVKIGTIEIPQKAIGEPFVPFVLEALSIEGNALPEISAVNLVPKQD